MNEHALNAKIRTLRGRLLKMGDYEALCRGESVFASNLEDSSYKGELERILRFVGDARRRRLLAFLLGEGQKLSTALETQLDYYTLAWAKVKSLQDRQDMEALKHVLGVEIDLYNLMALYRLKSLAAHRGKNPFPYLVPLQYRLAALPAMAESAGTSELLVEIQHTPYRHFDGSRQAQAQLMGRAVAVTAKRYPRSLAETFRYFFEKRIQTQNLQAIREGLRYALPAEQILSFLIFPH